MLYNEVALLDDAHVSELVARILTHLIHIRHRWVTISGRDACENVQDEAILSR